MYRYINMNVLLFVFSLTVFIVQASSCRRRSESVAKNVQCYRFFIAQICSLFTCADRPSLHSSLTLIYTIYVMALGMSMWWSTSYNVTICYWQKGKVFDGVDVQMLHLWQLVDQYILNMHVNSKFLIEKDR